MKLLLIRAEDGAKATAARAEALGLDSDIMPLFHIAALDWQVPDPNAYDALLITSANAVHLGGAGLSRLQSLPVYAVGAKSAQRAAEAGFDIAAAGTGDAAEIAAIAHKDGMKRLLWLTGKQHIDLTPPPDMQIDRHIIYSAARLPAPPHFAQRVRGADITALHSPRAARYFCKLCEEHDLDKGGITLAALSANVAQAAGNGWAEIIVAKQPSDNALLSNIASRFTNASRDP